MNETTIAAFLAATADARTHNGKSYTERCAEALAAISGEVVFNVDYVNAKDTLNRAVDSAWDAVIKADATTGWDVICKFGHMMSAHDAISMSKKLAKVEGFENMKAFCAAVLPVALLLKDLKNKTVKGRKPNPEVEARKAVKLENQMDRATCGCCFGSQAVLPNGLIHDHGYRIPREYMKTASCDGRDFHPLEVSDEGPKHMVVVLEAAEKTWTAEVGFRKVQTSITLTNRYTNKSQTFKVGDDSWARVLSNHIADAERTLDSVRRDLASFRKVVAEWKPGQVAANPFRKEG